MMATSAHGVTRVRMANVQRHLSLATRCVSTVMATVAVLKRALDLEAYARVRSEVCVPFNLIQGKEDRQTTFEAMSLSMIAIHLMTYQSIILKKLRLKSRLLDATFVSLTFGKPRNSCDISSRQMALNSCCHGNWMTSATFTLHSRQQCVRNIT